MRGAHRNLFGGSERRVPGGNSVFLLGGLPRLLHSEPGQISSGLAAEPKPRTAVTKRIAIILGHPDGRGNHFGHALVDVYKKSAEAAGHEVRLVDVGKAEFPLLRSKNEYETGTPPEAIQQGQHTVAWADHLVIYFPLWLGAMPALLKGFLEQVLRPGFAYRAAESGGMPKKLLRGKSARIIITMGMPAFVYRWYFGAHGLKNLKRNILGLCGVHPIRESLIGMVEGSDAHRKKWLAKMENLGRSGQ